MDKEITLAFANSFSGNAMFHFSTSSEQKIAFQNLILNGAIQNECNASAITTNFSSTLPDTQGIWHFENVDFEKFNSDRAVITVFDADASFINCRIQNNYGRRSGGVEVFPGAFAEIVNCVFADNQSIGNGTAIRCRGSVRLAESSITGNQAINDGIVKNGGGLYVDVEASCEVLSCAITGNAADIGGGVACFGTLSLCDTFICGNTGQLGGSDIRAGLDSNISVTYTNNMKAVYTENDPLGFYADDFENPFNAKTNITALVGETLELHNNTSPNFGVRFLFASDLPATPPPPTLEPDSSAENHPILPIYPDTNDEKQPPFIEVEPNYSEIEIVPIPEEEPTIQAPITPDLTPAPVKVAEDISTLEPSSSTNITTPAQPETTEKLSIEADAVIQDTVETFTDTEEHQKKNTISWIWIAIPISTFSAISIFLFVKRKLHEK